MYPGRHWHSGDAEFEAAKRQTAGLVGIVVVLVLLVIGLFLVQQLRTCAKIEDCLLSGRRNCDVLVHHDTPPQPEP